MTHLKIILDTLLTTLLPIITFLVVRNLKNQNKEKNYFYAQLFIGIALAAELFRAITVIILLLNVEAIISYQAAWIRGIFMLLGVFSLLKTIKKEELVYLNLTGGGINNVNKQKTHFIKPDAIINNNDITQQRLSTLLEKTIQTKQKVTL